MSKESIRKHNSIKKNPNLLGKFSIMERPLEHKACSVKEMNELERKFQIGKQILNCEMRSLKGTDLIEKSKYDWLSESKSLLLKSIRTQLGNEKLKGQLHSLSLDEQSVFGKLKQDLAVIECQVRCGLKLEEIIAIKIQKYIRSFYAQQSLRKKENKILEMFDKKMEKLKHQYF